MIDYALIKVSESMTIKQNKITSIDRFYIARFGCSKSELHKAISKINRVRKL